MDAWLWLRLLTPAMHVLDADWRAGWPVLPRANTRGAGPRRTRRRPSPRSVPPPAGWCLRRRRSKHNFSAPAGLSIAAVAPAERQEQVLHSAEAGPSPSGALPAAPRPPLLRRAPHRGQRGTAENTSHTLLTVRAGGGGGLQARRQGLMGQSEVPRVTQESSWSPGPEPRSACLQRQSPRLSQELSRTAVLEAGGQKSGSPQGLSGTWPAASSGPWDASMPGVVATSLWPLPGSSRGCLLCLCLLVRTLQGHVSLD